MFQSNLVFALSVSGKAADSSRIRQNQDHNCITLYLVSNYCRITPLAFVKQVGNDHDPLDKRSVRFYCSVIGFRHLAGYFRWTNDVQCRCWNSRCHWTCSWHQYGKYFLLFVFPLLFHSLLIFYFISRVYYLFAGDGGDGDDSVNDFSSCHVQHQLPSPVLLRDVYLAFASHWWKCVVPWKYEIALWLLTFFCYFFLRAWEDGNLILSNLKFVIISLFYVVLFFSGDWGDF